MCRHLAYLGPPVLLRTLLFDEPHALVRQAQAPRYQRAGRDNPDGWGVGWKTEGDVTGGHQRYRAATRMWEDRGFAGEEQATVVLAAARYASPGSELLLDNVAPFAADDWLFSLNGFVSDFRDGFGDELRSKVSPRREQGIEGDTDSEVLFALVLDELDAGASPGDALAEVVRIVRAQSTGALNLLLTDGNAIVATAIDNSLFLRNDSGLLVASEPLDDGDSWIQVDNGSLVVNDHVTPIGGLP